MSDRATNGVYRKYDAGRGKRQPGQNGDCQVRALHKAWGMAYDEAWEALYALQGKYRTCGFDITFYLDKGSAYEQFKQEWGSEASRLKRTSRWSRPRRRHDVQEVRSEI